MLTTIPFMGFYETVIDSLLSEEVPPLAEWLNQRDDGLRGRGEDAIAEAINDCIAWSAVYRTIARDYAEAFAEAVNELAGWDLGLTYESLHSPRFYNFETDRIFAEVRLEALVRMRAETPESTLAAAIADRFRPRSGFIPFYSDDVRDWRAKPMDRWDCNEAGTLLIAFLTHKGGDGVLDELERQCIESLTDDACWCDAVNAHLDEAALRAKFALAAVGA